MMKHKAFTLLEILLVIAAIGILAAIVIVAINPQRQLAQVRDAERLSDIRTLYNAFQQHAIQTGLYPSELEGITTATRIELCASGVEQSDCETEGLLYVGSLVPDYIASIPRDPSRGESSGAGYEAYIDDGRLIGLIAPLVEVDKKYPEVGVSWTISLDEDVQSYLQRINAAGGSIADNTLASLDSFVKELKAENVWDDIHELGTFTGEDLNTALHKLKYRNEPVLENIGYLESDYDKVLGMVNATGEDKYLGTGYIPRIEMSSEDSGHLSIFISSDDLPSTGGVAIGAESLDEDLDLIYFNYGEVSGGEISGRERPAGGWLSEDFQALFTASRIASNNMQMYRNDESLFNNMDSNTKLHANAEVYVGGLNYQDNPFAISEPGDVITGSYSLYSMGEGFTQQQVAAFSNAINELHQNIGRPTFQ